MSLNNIQLNTSLLTTLYPTLFIEPTTTNVPKTDYKFLGNNKKKILILVSKTDVAFLEETELNFLSNVLAACKFSVADVSIVNANNLPANTAYHSLIEYFNSKFVLLFDTEPQIIDLPFNFPHFQIQNFNQCTYLSAPPLKQMEADKSLKTKLWNSLKNLFGL